MIRSALSRCRPGCAIGWSMIVNDRPGDRLRALRRLARERPRPSASRSKSQPTVTRKSSGISRSVNFIDDAGHLADGAHLRREVDQRFAPASASAAASTPSDEARQVEDVALDPEVGVVACRRCAAAARGRFRPLGRPCFVPVPVKMTFNGGRRRRDRHHGRVDQRDEQVLGAQDDRDERSRGAARNRAPRVPCDSRCR